MSGVVLRLGDCRDILAKCKPNCVDSVVTDPPYGLSKEPKIEEVLTHWLAGDDYKHKGNGFMGKSWDSFVPGPATWKEVFRVLKPGGHLLCFAGSRTVDLMGISLRMTGFEIRDQIMWVYGSGFPKSMDVSKALDKAAGAERTETIGVKPGHEGFASRDNLSSVQSFKGTMGGEGGFARPWMDDPKAVERYHMQFAPSTDAAKQWDGWGTALKPAYESIIVARKPLIGTVAANVLAHGVGGLNIDGCRVGTSKDVPTSVSRIAGKVLSGSADGTLRNETGKESGHNPNIGRFPSNLIHDGSAEVRACFPDAGGQQGALWGTEKPNQGTAIFGDYGPRPACKPRVELDKSAARFFYCAKASKSDRGEGNNHPTVKPIALMRYLVRLVTPPNGLVLDCFMGSGSTGKAAKLEGFKFFGITDEQPHMLIAERRIKDAI